MVALERIDSIGDELKAELEPPSRRGRWLSFSAFVLLAFVIAIIIVDADTRQLIGDAWREMLDISPALLFVIVVFKIGQALFSALTWRNILAAAYPDHPLPLGFVLGIDQGQDAVNMVSPVRAGTWAMLGLFRLSIPGARAGGLMAVWGVQTIAYAVFALVNYVVLALFLPGAVEGRGDATERLRTYGADRPLISTVIVIAVLGALAFLLVRLRRRLIDFKEQAVRGAAILGTPRRYFLLVFIPSFLSVLCRCGTYGVLLAAFEIPVTFWTVALATGAHALAGAVRVTPGGVGTTQAIDVIALREYAPAETVTAYSLSEAAITAIVSFVLSLMALVAVLGFSGTYSLLRNRPNRSIDFH
jgi:uncharacterized membrane protein YbhN (UPF0104 family)